MQFSLEEAKELRRQLLIILKGHSSNVEIHPADGSGYRVLVHKRDRTLPDLPVGVEVIEEDLADPVDNVNLDKTTPGKPSHFSKDLGKPLTDSNRNVEPPEDFQMRRRDFQDIVKRYATVEKLAQVAQSITVLAGQRDAQVDAKLEEIREALLRNNYRTSSKLWKTLMSVFYYYNIEDAEELYRRMRDEKFGPLEAAKQVVQMLKKRAGLSPEPGDGAAKDLERQKLAKDTSAQLIALEKVLDSMVEKMRRLGLKEEANQLSAMASSTRDIYSVVSRLED